MSVSKSSVSFLQVCMILLLSTGMLNHVIIIPLLLQQSGRDGWLSIVMVMALSLLWIPVILWTIKKKGKQTIYEWLNVKTGPYVAWIVILILVTYLLTVAFITLKDTASWTTVSYLPRTPLFVIVVSLAFLSAACALAGIRSIAICSGMLLPVVIILGYFVMGANMQYKNYTLMFPVLENGTLPVLQGMIFGGAGMVELIMVLFLQHHISTKINFWGLAMLAIFLGGLTIGPYIGAIANFGRDTAVSLRFPTFEQWRLVTVGKYINHVDFFSIFQWLSGAFIRISLAMFLIYDLLPCRSKGVKAAVCIISVLLLISVIQISMSDMMFLTWLHDYYYPVVTIGVLVCSGIFALIACFANTPKRTI
ncbi:GerAB/ArcD/ProY family transporter [Paenibacillus taiwanensis]|uniref:GerAB/ArcD/ProY family transporter n=1 Tax=Paenibacillus taiwanensis TaxID=401638 RepID=UPI0003F77C0F|nr:endospore germination permease [Paenibacillus taiwanensis]